jgi:protein involved in polysaccharide export with SLBB domain
MTVLEAIMEAGGFDPNRAKLSEVTVIRNEKGKQTNYRVDLKKVIAGRDPNPFYVKPFDIIHVPVKTFNL